MQPLLGRLVEVTDDCLMNISDAEAKGAESGGAGAKLTSWRLRVAMAEAFVLLFRADPRLLGGELLEAFQDFLQARLGPCAGRGRVARDVPASVGAQAQENMAPTLAQTSADCARLLSRSGGVACSGVERTSVLRCPTWPRSCLATAWAASPHHHGRACALQGMLKDESYGARLAATRLVQVGLQRRACSTA